MKIRIIGTESLGVRGMACVVETDERKIIIDPGIALGLRRNGRMPHPVQIGVGRIIRRRIARELQSATDVVLSHFHGDHVPLAKANPYQMSFDQAGKIPETCRVWALNPEPEEGTTVSRKKDLEGYWGGFREAVAGGGEGPISFLGPFPHGETGSLQGQVVMTRLEDETGSFIHASDLQLLEDAAVEAVLADPPQILFVSGPPLYLAGPMKGKRKAAYENAKRLAGGVETLILDHHLMRSDEGPEWVERLSSHALGKVQCAADFMGMERHLLEAWRGKLYADLPVPEGWHFRYASGLEDVEGYMDWARGNMSGFRY